MYAFFDMKVNARGKSVIEASTYEKVDKKAAIVLRVSVRICDAAYRNEQL
jgi:hypothetical protein